MENSPILSREPRESRELEKDNEILKKSLASLSKRNIQMEGIIVGYEEKLKAMFILLVILFIIFIITILMSLDYNT